MRRTTTAVSPDTLLRPFVAAAATVVVLVAARLPLTSSGSGSSVGVIELTRTVSIVANGPVQVACWAAVAAMASGLLLGPLSLWATSWSRRLQSVIGAMIALASMLAICALGANSGPAVFLLLVAGLLICGPAVANGVAARSGRLVKR